MDGGKAPKAERSSAVTEPLIKAVVRCPPLRAFRPARSRSRLRRAQSPPADPRVRRPQPRPESVNRSASVIGHSKARFIACIPARRAGGTIPKTGISVRAAHALSLGRIKDFVRKDRGRYCRPYAAASAARRCAARRLVGAPENDRGGVRARAGGARAGSISGSWPEHRHRRPAICGRGSARSAVRRPRRCRPISRQSFSSLRCGSR